jgi:hypothetical protein
VRRRRFTVAEGFGRSVEVIDLRDQRRERC